jgi:hypothetical protein
VPVCGNVLAISSESWEPPTKYSSWKYLSLNVRPLRRFEISGTNYQVKRRHIPEK